MGEEDRPEVSSESSKPKLPAGETKAASSGVSESSKLKPASDKSKERVSGSDSSKTKASKNIAAAAGGWPLMSAWGGYGAWPGAPMQYSHLLHAQAYVAQTHLMQQYNPYATPPQASQKQDKKKSKTKKKEKKEKRKNKHGGERHRRSKKSDNKKIKGFESESLNSTSSSNSHPKHGTGHSQSKKTKTDSTEMQESPGLSQAADQRDRLQTLLSGLEVDEEDDTEELSQRGVWADSSPKVPRPSSAVTGAASRPVFRNGSLDFGAKEEVERAAHPMDSGAKQESERAARPSLAPQLLQSEATQQHDNSATLAPKSDKERNLYEWLRGLDNGNSALLRYFRVLKEEFASDFEQIKNAQVGNTNSSGLLSTIDPRFWEVCGIKNLSHRVLLAKGIKALNSSTGR